MSLFLESYGLKFDIQDFQASLIFRKQIKKGSQKQTQNELVLLSVKKRTKVCRFYIRNKSRKVPTVELSNEYSYLQMSVNSNTPNKSQQQSNNLQPKIGTSTYVVNNSLVCCLRPKRASFDIKLYLQLHKKLTRKAVIEKKFQESVYQFSNPNEQPRQGFKGKRRPQSFLCKSHSLRQKQKRVYTEESASLNETTDNWTQCYWKALSRKGEATSLHQTSINSRVKPNMMYNLSLYRKSFKHSSLKREKMCLTIMENIQRTRRELTQERRERNPRSSKAHTTIS